MIREIAVSLSLEEQRRKRRQGQRQGVGPPVRRDILRVDTAQITHPGPAVVLRVTVQQFPPVPAEGHAHPVA